MNHEPHDTAVEAKAYNEDMQQQRENDRAALAEQRLVEWAQRQGNSSGFDRYADL